ncbi:MAG TPA: hypothetical protein ENF73_01250 [Proteobacteria bacterium]|nr:hypothetical protein [Pseudomonadota bacterium]
MRTVAILLVAALLLFAGCEPMVEGGDPQKSIDQMIDEGKTYLALGDGDRAREIFLEALVFEPDNTDAHFGVALADVLRFVKLVESLDEYISEYLDQGEGSKGDGDREGIGDFIHGYAKHLRLDTAEELTWHTWRIYQIVDERDFSFHLSSYPVTYRGELLLMCRGEWDGAELRLVWGIGHLLMGVVHTLLGTDLNFDIGPILALPIDFESLLNDPTSVDWAELFPLLVDALLEILTDPDYPNFLLLTPDGRELYSTAGIELGLFCSSAVEATHFVMGETDPQNDDVIGYVDVNGNGRYDEGDSVRLPEPNGVLDEDGFETLWALFYLMNRLSSAFFDTTYMDPHPTEPDPFYLSDLNPLIAALLDENAFGLPPIPIEIGPYFQNPAPEEIKQFLIDFLMCLDKEDPTEMINCLLELLTDYMG